MRIIETLLLKGKPDRSFAARKRFFHARRPRQLPNRGVSKVGKLSVRSRLLMRIG